MVTDPFRQGAGVRDGAMSCLIGIAARNSIDSGKPVRIDSLTPLKPVADKLKDETIAGRKQYSILEDAKG
jgi:hypothetical protein